MRSSRNEDSILVITLKVSDLVWMEKAMAKENGKWSGAHPEPFPSGMRLLLEGPAPAHAATRTGCLMFRSQFSAIYHK